MNYVKYSRTFVMLEEQTSEFASRKAPVKGYLKVETGNNKGALRCVVQNLKYYSGGEYIYKLIFFGKKGDKTIHTVPGSLAINRNGNGETYFRFDPLNMDGEGNSYADFNMAIVAAVSGTSEKEPLHPVLKGMMSKTDTTKTAAGQTQEEKLCAEPARFSGVQPEQTAQMEQSVQTEQSEQPEQAQPQSESNLQESKIRKEAEPMMQEAQTEILIYNSFYNEYLLQFCGYTCRAANYYEDVFPFEKDRTGARWKRIRNIASLPLVSPGAHFFATQYRHFLFGAKPDEKGVACRYYFAVPGRFIQEEQPDGGRSGFVFWQPVTSSALPDDLVSDQAAPGYGYWIVAVDAYTGDIIEAG